jgi:hypothetical protein
MTSKSKSWRDLLPVHPAAELFPMMSEEGLRTVRNETAKQQPEVAAPSNDAPDNYSETPACLERSEP